MVIAEDCVKLHANQLKANYGQGRLTGWVTVGYRLFPDKVCLVWAHRGGQRIERIRLPLKGEKGGWVRWYICPLCRQKTPVLYLPPNGGSFGCLRCLKVRFQAWRTCGQWRQPKTPEAWAKWFMRRAGRCLNEQKVKHR